MSSFEERRRARQSWPIRVVPLAVEGRPDPRDTTTVGERVALVWALTCEQWASSGRDPDVLARRHARDDRARAMTPDAHEDLLADAEPLRSS